MLARATVRTRNSVLLAGRRSPIKSALPSARQRTRQTYVPSPSVPGCTDRVEKIIDPIENMLRHRRIGAAEFKAAEIFRKAWETAGSGIGNTMDFDRPRGVSSTGHVPGSPQMLAAETIAEARNRLYHVDYKLLRYVVGEGCSIAEATSALWLYDITPAGQPRAPTREDRLEIGRRLIWILRELVTLWHLHVFMPNKSERPRITARRLFDPREMVSSEQAIMPGKTAHAGRTAGRFIVKMSGAKERK